MPGRVSVLALVALAFASPALAQSPPDATASSADREARARFESGRLAFDDQRYEEALADFERSYELSGRSIILFNIGLVHDRLRRDGEALDAFRRYLEAVPDAENRAEVERRIEVLQAALDERRWAPQPAPMPMPDAQAAPASPSSASMRPLFELGGWLAGGLALAVGIGAGVTWAVANDQYAQLDARCGAAGCPRAEIDASGAPGLVTATNVLFVSAIVAALCSATAWTLYALDVGHGPSATARLRVSPLGLTLTF